MRAAALAADLFAQYLQGHHRYSDRVVLKADVMILASAKAAGATEFYSNDDDCRKLAVLAGMRGRELPTDNTMENKWYLGELRSGEAT